MRNRVICFLLLIGLSTTAFSQTVNITGKVTNSGGQAIEGAVIKIFATALACTSKTDGTYALTGEAITAITDKPRMQPNRITYQNQAFTFNVAEPVAASAKLFDLHGRKVADIFNGRLTQGTTKIPCSLTSFGNTMLILHTKINTTTASYRINPALDASFTLDHVPQKLNHFSATAAVDWLQASKTGYASHVQSLDSYTGVVNITLNNVTAPNFGNNVKIFDPTMQMSSIQSTMNGLSSNSEMSSNRTAYFFKPGKYTLTVRINYYIHALGLGMSPDDVEITGPVQSLESLTAFWRGAENLSVSPSGGTNMWSVSQAAPFRRMHIKGNQNLSNNVSTSGGWISDSKIDGNINSGSQQQFYTRNSQIGGWNGGVWNMFFHGVIGAPADNWPNGVYTNIAQVPLVREKPFITIDGSGNYSVFMPALRTNSSGTTWYNATPAGTSIPIDQFYIAIAGTDNVTTINAALAQGKNLLLTPGIYNVSEPIQVMRPNTVVLGIGFPSIVSQNGTIGMKVADVDGITIAGLMFDASGSTEVPVQLQVGDAVSTKDHSANPTFLFDIFSRIGGYVSGKVATSVIINSNNVFFDHCWIWRADHGTGVGWTNNTSKNGMIINGTDVTCYGQFMEHHQQYQTIWNGENGRNYFFQNEMPYEVPSQSVFNHDGINGWASYKVGDSVTKHEAWGLGVYAFFNRAPIKVDNGIETPKLPGIKFHHIYIKSLGGNQGEISHAINGVGEACTNAHSDVKVNEYVGGQ